MYFPNEIIDLILLQGSFSKALRLKRNYVIKKLYNPKKHTWKWASWRGHLETIKFLHFNRTEGCTKWEMNHAAHSGHLEVVKFLHKNRTEGCTKHAMNWAAMNGHIEVVKFLHENRTEGCCISYAMEQAAMNGHLEVVKFLHENKLFN